MVGSIQRIPLEKLHIFTITKMINHLLLNRISGGFFYELVLYPSENPLYILPFARYPSANGGGFFDTAKKDSTMSPLEFLISKIKLGLKLLQRGRPLKELRGRHVVLIQFFAL